MGQRARAVAHVVRGPVAAAAGVAAVHAALPSPAFWRGRRTFITGHTGFKGGWLALWLQELGAQLTGYALAPSTEPSLFAGAHVGDRMTSRLGDLRAADALEDALRDAAPEVVLHLAAQPLVFEGYRDPVTTYATNVMGTVHLLDAVRRVDTVRAVVNVTTDKCYANRESPWGYRESDELGGADPYSSSKACAELVTDAMRRSFFADGRVAVASARAGNVIGGGDWSRDRLLPDLVRAIARGDAAALRRPNATRPWQHVLDPLAGYLLLAERLLTEGEPWARSWNFGPTDDAQTVQWIADRACQAWGDGAVWHAAEAPDAPHETTVLTLDSTRARRQLGWQPRLATAAAVDWTIQWHRAPGGAQGAYQRTVDQIRAYTNLMPAPMAPPYVAADSASHVRPLTSRPD